MLKRFIGGGLLMVLLGVGLQTYSHLNLYFFIIYSLMIPVLVWAAECESKVFFSLTIGGSFVLFVFAFPRSSVNESFLYITVFAALVVAYRYYVRSWKKRFSEAHKLAQTSLNELDSLRHKFSSRVDNLKHLEGQVSGLLDLFEISRDFSERLSYDGVADILHKKVLPEFPAKVVELFVREKKATGQFHPLTYFIHAHGLQKTETEFNSDEIRMLTVRLDKLKDQSHDENWIFQLNQDESLQTCLVVRGSERHDFAKYEVLCAYLPLHLKKIKLYEEVKELAIRDSLTGVFVRRHFINRFEEELRRSIRYDLRLALFMLDIDHFKRYNDEHGHLAGDETLKEVSKVLCESLRKVDIVARYGGEEFIVVLPEAKKDGALEVAERIRSSIARHKFKVFQEHTRVTVSMGVALFPDHSIIASRDDLNVQEIARDLIQRADKALYQAKEEGRNRVVLFEVSKGDQ